MTFSSARQKIKLTTTVKPRFERIRIVEAALPEVVRTEFQKRNELVTAEAECAPEKLMPCGMRYPEPFRARPNFFIPILAVGSYVVPFFMLLSLALISKILPGFGQLSVYAQDHGLQIHLRSNFDLALSMLLCIAAPMVVGAVSAYMLSKETKVKLRLKILSWLVTMSIFCVAEFYFAAFLSNS